MGNFTNSELRQMIKTAGRKAHPLVQGVINSEAKYATKDRLKHIYTHLRVTKSGDIDLTKRQRRI